MRWFDENLDRFTRRWFLTRTLAASSAMAAGLPNLIEPTHAEESSKPAAQRSSDTSVPYGTSTNLNSLRSDAQYRDAVIRYCDLIVPEGDLKWDPLRPRQNEFNFSGADAILRFATAHNIGLRGHTLVWYAALPKWVEEVVTSRQVAEAELASHISRVVGRYRGKIGTWDVVNEAIADDPNAKQDLRDSVWLRHLGRDYISMAFQIAHESDPSARLYLNEYDVEYVGPRFQAKRDALLSLVRELKEKNVPIHGVGIQGHLESRYQIDTEAFMRFLRSLKNMGLDLMVTELDVIDDNFPGDPTERDERSAAMVRTFLDCVFSVARPTAIVTWGISDRYSWVPIYRKRADGLPFRPLPLDNMMQPKKMMSVIDQFRHGKP